MSYASLPLDYQWLVLGCARFAKILSELTKTWSSGATECKVWIGNCNVKVWKTTEHTLHKIWCSLKFCQISGKRTHPRNAHYKSFHTLILNWAVLGCACFAEMLQNCMACQVFGIMCSIVSHALTLKLPIQTVLSLAPTCSVFWRATISAKRAHPWHLN